MRNKHNQTKLKGIKAWVKGHFSVVAFSSKKPVTRHTISSR